MSKRVSNFFKLEIVLLKILQNKDRYGYEIVQLLTEASNGRINIAEGTMYPILYKLLESGQITGKKVLVGKRQTRIYYHIEPEGLEYLKKLEGEYNAFKEGVDHLIAEVNKGTY